MISHRGNISGPNPEKENSPCYILDALKKYEVEIDVWFINSVFYLGHNAPVYPISSSFLRHPKLWCHAKNIEALVEMLKDEAIHCFWHQTDDVVLTSRKYIWAYPGKRMSKERGIAVCPERVEGWDIDKAVGVCSDYIFKY